MKIGVYGDEWYPVWCIYEKDDCIASVLNT